jgi:type II secretory pathway predicted ATPase ExeA
MRFLLFTAQHREVLCNLEYGLSAAKPVTVLIGDAGTGKSTLVRAALESEVYCRVMCLFIDNALMAGFALDRQVDAISCAKCVAISIWGRRRLSRPHGRHTSPSSHRTASALRVRLRLLFPDEP